MERKIEIAEIAAKKAKIILKQAGESNYDIEKPAL